MLRCFKSSRGWKEWAVTYKRAGGVKGWAGAYTNEQVVCKHRLTLNTPSLFLNHRLILNTHDSFVKHRLIIDKPRLGEQQAPTRWTIKNSWIQKKSPLVPDMPGLYRARGTEPSVHKKGQVSCVLQEELQQQQKLTLYYFPYLWPPPPSAFTFFN